MMNRRAIELRYEVLPHIYNVMHDASVSGLPALRPLMLEFPNDPATYGLDDEVMFGRDLLIAPVLWPHASERSVYLPQGTWVDFWTGARFTGGTRHRVPVTLRSIPIFARAGAFVFEHPVVQHTGELRGQALRVMVMPGADGEATLYEDDGETRAYAQGMSVTRVFRHQTTADTATIAIGAPTGPFRPAGRDLWLLVRRTNPITCRSRCDDRPRRAPRGRGSSGRRRGDCESGAGGSARVGPRALSARRRTRTPAELRRRSRRLPRGARTRAEAGRGARPARIRPRRSGTHGRSDRRVRAGDRDPPVVFRRAIPPRGDVVVDETGGPCARRAWPRGHVASHARRVSVLSRHRRAAAGRSHRRHVRVSRAHAPRSHQRRGVLRPWPRPQATGRLRGSRTRIADGHAARSRAARSALHARRGAVADRPRRRGRGAVQGRIRAASALRGCSLHARHDLQAARRSRRGACGVSQNDPAQPCIGRGAYESRSGVAGEA